MMVKIKSVSWLNLVLVCLLTSCSTSKIAQHPNSWAKPALIHQNTCADISGTYENKAIASPSNKYVELGHRYPDFLSYFIARDSLNGYKHEWVTHVKFSGVQGKSLTLVFYKKDKIINSKSFTINHDYTCTAKGIVFESSHNEVYGIYGGFSHQVTRLIFIKAEDGSLLLTKDFSEKGLALVVPVSNEEVSLYKYKKTNY